jgi:uncharacterized protein (DUF885 family)
LSRYTTYGEGWALHAETLGFDVGLYKDSYSRYGYLQWQVFRAARLVVDAGIHALGWSRQQAIDFMAEQTGVQLATVISEVDRYISQPGQALSVVRRRPSRRSPTTEVPRTAAVRTSTVRSSA